MATTEKSSRWGVGVAVLYGSFVLFTLAIVAVASLQHFDLVEDQYYEKSLDYQKQIDRIDRTNALAERPSIRFNRESKELILEFPLELAKNRVSGTIVMYRPSGAVMDLSFPLTLENGIQHISLGKAPAGFWKAKLKWESAGSGYYLEDSFFVE